MTVTALGVKPATTQAATSSSATVNVAFQNALAATQAKVVPISLGSARDDKPLLKPGLEAQTYDLQVAPGTTKLEVEIHADSADAQVSLLVLYPATERRIYGYDLMIVAYDINPGATKHVELKNPKPGRYIIVLDPVRIPKEGLTVSYRDVLYHPLFGEVICDDTAADLKPGDTKTAAVSFDVQARPEKGRMLVAEVGLFSDDVVSMSFERSGGKRTDPPKVSTEKVPIATQLLAVGP
jgi:hypothetical protein